MLRKIFTDLDKKQAAFLMEPCGPCPDDEIEEVVKDLMDTAKKSTTRCAGLAANQIGHPYTVCVVLEPKSGELIAIVNPKVIAKMGGIKTGWEECLSRPNRRYKRRRYKKIKIEYYDVVSDQRHTRLFEGFWARVIQHELDHFKGILI